MRVVLITVDQPPEIAGRGLALRQLDFAIAAGAERVLACGDGLSPAMIALRHATEKAGLRFQHLPTPQALLGTVGTADQLLVLGSSLLPDSADAVAALAGGPCILSLPASAGIAAGFERIDPQRAWAGALVLPGNLVEQVAALPADFEPPSALLRIALQGRVPDRPLPPGLLDTGAWLVADPALVPALEQAWLKRRDPGVGQGSLTDRITGWLVRRFGLRLLAEDRSTPAALGLAALLLVTGLGLVAQSVDAAGLALVGLAGIPLALARVVARLRDTAFAPRQEVDHLPWVLDLALVAAVYLALDGMPLERLFPPAILVLAQRLCDHRRLPGWISWLPDRLAGALFVAFGAAIGQTGPMVMVLALLLLAAELTFRRPSGELTRI